MTAGTNENLAAVLCDPARIAALRATGLLDSPPEKVFDRLTDLARRMLGVPVCLISLVECDRQFFKSCAGLPEPWASLRETHLSHSFCQHVVHTGAPLVVEDAREHPLLRDNLA
ncbi:MAG: GAF domain-containing protein, partial [Rhodomicrobium sp.]